MSHVISNRDAGKAKKSKVENPFSKSSMFKNGLMFQESFKKPRFILMTNNFI